ncbi:hypothetical protein ONS96_010357 [Cadophora gregata f. sp. sojae]|nr:hypothetical protein ONS96_010357 [Cadophora gregata f. sp. sojae]
MTTRLCNTQLHWHHLHPHTGDEKLLTRTYMCPVLYHVTDQIFAVVNMSAPPQVRVGVGVFILESSSESPSNPSFLIGKRIGSHGAGTYALPGGHLEFGETPEECAAREVLEETGLKISNIKFSTATNDVMEKDEKHYITLFVVGVRDDVSQVPEVLEKEKCEGWEWLRWEELVALVERDGKGDEMERRLFIPLLNMVRQRPGVVPALK